MRTIQVDESDSGHTWLWLAAGVALGLVAAQLVSDRKNGRRGSLRALLRGGRRLAGLAVEHAGPLMETARDLTDAFRDRGRDDEESDTDGDEYEEDALDARVLEAFVNDPILAERFVEI